MRVKGVGLRVEGIGFVETWRAELAEKVPYYKKTLTKCRLSV